MPGFTDAKAFLQRILFPTLAATALAGCVSYSPTVPKDYAGPVATIKDSAVAPYSSTKANMFYVSRVDGLEIANSHLATLDRNRGHGRVMTPVALRHSIPARPITVTLVGRTEYATPILALTHTVYQVTGDVAFTPEPNKTYRVTGELGENYSAVWIEDAETRTLIGRKIEIQGPAKLGVFEK